MRRCRTCLHFNLIQRHEMCPEIDPARSAPGAEAPAVVFDSVTGAQVRNCPGLEDSARPSAAAE